MSYATQSQLEARYGARMLIDLTDRGEFATGGIDAGVVAAALASADALIDGHLQAYALPLIAVPPLLSDLACAIAIWRLHTGMPGDKVKADYDDARRTLDQIGRGVVRLQISGQAPAGSGTSGALATDRDRPFEAAKMTGFI